MVKKTSLFLFLFVTFIFVLAYAVPATASQQTDKLKPTIDLLQGEWEGVMEFRGVGVTWVSTSPVRMRINDSLASFETFRNRWELPFEIKGNNAMLPFDYAMRPFSLRTEGEFLVLQMSYETTGEGRTPMKVIVVLNKRK